MTTTPPDTRNFFADIPAALPQELVETWLQAEGLRIERIVSRGHTAPADGGWYEQAEHEWVMLVQGEAELEWQGEAGQPPARQRLRAGDALLIPAGRRHRVSWTPPQRDSVWLAVFFSAARLD